MAVTRGPKQRGEARLHGAVRRLSGLCLVGSWQTATNLTDWLSECWNNRKSPAKLRNSRGGKQAKAACSMTDVDAHNELSIYIRLWARVCLCDFRLWEWLVVCSLKHHKRTATNKQSGAAVSSDYKGGVKSLLGHNGGFSPGKEKKKL